jgi:hypothetical protein
VDVVCCLWWRLMVTPSPASTQVTADVYHHAWVHTCHCYQAWVLLSACMG